MLVSLSQQERDKFAAWCDQERNADTMIAEQSAKLGAIGEVIAKNKRIEGMAMEIVARVLRSIETQEIM